MRAWKRSALNPELKQRLKLFGMGASVGTLLSILLFMVWSTKYEKPAEETLKIVVSTCDLRPGDDLKESCTEIRSVTRRFVPPGSLEAGRLPYALNKKLNVAVPAGNAFRSEDVEGLPPR